MVLSPLYKGHRTFTEDVFQLVPAPILRSYYLFCRQSFLVRVDWTGMQWGVKVGPLVFHIPMVGI